MALLIEADTNSPLTKCPKCGYELYLAQDLSYNAECPMCGTLVRKKTGEKDLKTEKSESKGESESKDKSRKIIMVGMIIFFLIVAISPFGAFGYFNRVITTMGHGLHIDPICGCSAEPITYKIMKNGIQTGTEIRYYNWGDAPSRIDGPENFADNIVIRAILILFGTVIGPIYLLVSSFGSDESSKALRSELWFPFIIWLFCWVIFLAFPLLRVTC